MATAEDGKRSLHIWREVTQLSISVNGCGACSTAVQVSNEYLPDGESVGRCLLGNLFQPIDPAELDLSAVATQLSDGAGEPLAGLALPGQLSIGRCLLAILA
jgi:hypothetical protein